MVYSMTGFGSAVRSSEQYQVTAELRSLNSKYFELMAKLPRMYNRYEGQLRNLLSERFARGKFALTITVEVLAAEKRSLQLNKKLAKRYLEELDELARELGLPEKSVGLPLLLELPEVIPSESLEEDPDEWNLIMEAIKAAADQLAENRRVEGQALSDDMGQQIARISEALDKVRALAPERINRIRQRIDQSMAELRTKVKDADPNRFEQELIFYLEKLDINEEMVRLSQHLQYFEELRLAEHNTGKQLQFLSQEIGREINTIGAKANDAEIQRQVVHMKEQLEKIKEQVLNVV